MKDNLKLYDTVRTVPKEAQKTITGGRLSGFTDINPMWRIKMLTEQFGAAGFGWYYDIKRLWLESGANDEVAAFAEIDLYVNQENVWSKPIKGVGGSSFISKEKTGLYTSDECYKMALTDAISTACKSLGMGADIYFMKDKSKYDNNTGSKPEANPSPDKEPPKNAPDTITEKQVKRLYAMSREANVDEETLKKIMAKHYNKNSTKELTRAEYDFICNQLQEMIEEQKNIVVVSK